jgi:saccharopine dehydrogenase-like NADP-dependent oxidoreductase
MGNSCILQYNNFRTQITGKVKMNKILVLGAGLVARPLVQYLLDIPDVKLKVASRTLSKADKLINNHPKGVAQQLNVDNDSELLKVISEADIIISLLPWIHHIKIANVCLEVGKNLVTTSYIKPEMKAMDKILKEKGLLFLNEIGVDPGIDHMAAMQIIDQVKKDSGYVESFYSYCGGLPALEHNDNPFGYKFSWSPEGVMLAAKNDGKYLKDGNIIEVSSSKLFEHYWLVDVPGAGTFEAYVNRDALPYRDSYNLQNVKSIYRGTLRNISHCESWNLFKKIGLLDQTKIFDFNKVAPREVLTILMQNYAKTLVNEEAALQNISEYSLTFKKMEWLGLFKTDKLPLGEASAFDMFAHLLKEKLAYRDGEVDMLVQHHEFIVSYAGNKKEKIVSTLIDKGIPGGDSSMARTVSLPAAIATKLILEGKINLTGVHIPVKPEIYIPVLAELETMNIKLTKNRLAI